MENTRDRVEDTILQAITEGKAFLLKRDTSLGFNFINQRRYHSLTELVLALNTVKTLVKLVKDEEGKDLLCGGKRP